MAMWSHGIDSSADSWASTFFTAGVLLLPLKFSHVIKLLHVFCTITLADVADQRCVRRDSAWRVSLIVSPDDHVPSFKSSLTLCLLNYPQWFVCCRPVPDLVQSGFECPEDLQPMLSVLPCRRSQLSPEFARHGLTMLASTSAVLP